MSLKVEDVAILFFSDGMRVDEKSLPKCKRLQEEKLVDAKGTLTELGKNVLAETKKVLEKSAQGVPFNKRKWAGKSLSIALRVMGEAHWATATFMKKTLVTNEQILFVTESLPWIKVAELPKASAELRQKLPLLWGRMKNLIQLFPHTFQIDTPTPLAVQFMWLCDIYQENFVAMAVPYYDAMRQKFPTATFWRPSVTETPRLGSFEPVFVKIRNQGVKGVVGIIAPFRPGFKTHPKPRTDWSPSGD